MPWALFLCLSVSVHAETLNSQKVLELTFGQSLTAKSLGLDRKIAGEDLRSAKSQYDLNFDGEVSYTNDQSERSSTIFGTKNTTTEFNFGLSQLTPLGSDVEVSFLNTKETTNSAFSTLPSYYNSQGYFALTQPILNNFFGFKTRKNLELARATQKQTNSSVDLALVDLAYQNLKLYWNWYLYEHLANVDEQALSSAIRLHQTNRAKLNVGLIESHDIHAFEANVALMRNALLTTQAELATAKGNVSVALDMTEDHMTLGAETHQQKKYPSWEAMAEQALKSHPKYWTLQHELEMRNISVAMDKNSKLPQLDLVGSLTLNGLDANYDAAVGDISDGHTVVQGGVTVSFPLQNRSARASFKKSQFQHRQLLYELKDVENQIVSQIKNSYVTYQKTFSRVAVVAEAVKQQKLKWGGEVEKQDQGRSDPDTVIRYQNDYLDARRLYIQTQVAYHLAELELSYARGELQP